jgi:hypothetical protein
MIFLYDVTECCVALTPSEKAATPSDRTRPIKSSAEQGTKVTVVNIFCLKEVHPIRLPTLLPYAQLVQTLLYPRSRRLTVGLLIIEAWHLRTPGHVGA